MANRGMPAKVPEGIASLSPIIVPLALMLGELLAQHEALVAKLIEQGLLDGEELDEFWAGYSEEHLPATRQRIVEALKHALEACDAPPPRPAEQFSMRGATARRRSFQRLRARF
jgi:hypothetical protein